ncbi:cell wall-binding repeat-containing protein [Kineococcus terrestris]|uniref:cell wall-binding repeat-containing protein n=1 Tax=Kineococcus terrestris TaxID=2044856 RepID=UPI0034DB2C61
MAGADRFATAAAIAGATFETGTTNAVLVNAYSPADALSAAAVAGEVGAAVLLTDAGSLNATTAAALEDLGVENVWIVGGTAAVSAAQETALEGDGYAVERLSGSDRVATSLDVLAELAAGDDAPTSAYLVRAFGNPADALAAGPIAYANGVPILPVPGAVPQSWIDTVEAAGITEVTVLGGTAAVPTQVETDLEAAGFTVNERISGASGQETAVAIANEAVANLGFSNAGVGIARGDIAANIQNSADALVSSQWLGTLGYPLLLTQSNTQLGAAAEGYLTDNAATLVEAAAFGGSAAIAPSVIAEAEEAGQTVTDALNSLAVAPNTAATLTLANEGGTTPTADDRTYTVTGLTDATQYRVTLVAASNISVVGGLTTFAIDRTPVGVTSTNPDGANGQQVSGNYLAAPGTVGAALTSVNGGAPVTNTGPGTATSPGTTSAVANPVNGSITFTVDGAATESVVPVVYVNGGAGLALTAGGPSPRLELNAQGNPVEAFGLGGAVTYVNPAATSQTVATSTAITSVNKAANQFDAASSTFTYKAGDTFSIGGVPATLDEFEAALSAGDTFGAAYSATTAASTFALTDANPVAPTGVAATATANDITVTVTLGGSGAAATIDNVVLQRATVTNGVVGTFTTIASPTTDADSVAAGFQYADNDVAVGSYQYRAAVVNDGQQSAFSAASTTVASTAPAADTAGPVATATTLVTDAGFSGILDAGDVFTVRADEALALPAAGSVIRVADGTVAGSSVADLVVGTNATVSLNAAAVPATPAGPNAGAAANTVLTVTVTAAPTVVTAGDVAGVAYPATIVNTSGVTDVAGNRLSLAAGAGVDLTIG